MLKVRSPFRYPEEAFAKGLIDGRLVDCLSVVQQLRFHHGYVQRERDDQDIALLDALIGCAGTT
jgi:lincosamide nucleotidyltransferase A/C/D/E